MAEVRKLTAPPQPPDEFDIIGLSLDEFRVIQRALSVRSRDYSNCGVQDRIVSGELWTTFLKQPTEVTNPLSRYEA